MKKLLILVLVIAVNCTLSFCQMQPNPITPKQDWKVGYKYSYKVTYNLKTSYIDPTKKTTIFIYQSLSILEEGDNDWKAKLEFDHLDKNGTKWDSDAEYRFLPNTLNYDLSIKKDTAEIEVLNMDVISTQFYDFLFPAFGKDRANDRIERIKNNEDIIGIPPRDFAFINSNTQKEFQIDKPIITDSIYEFGNYVHEETFDLDKIKDVYHYKNKLVVKGYSQRDTTNNIVEHSGNNTYSTTFSIDYDNHLIPIKSLTIIDQQFSESETIYLSSGDVRVHDPGFYTETVLVELIDTTKLPK